MPLDISIHSVVRDGMNNSSQTTKEQTIMATINESSASTILRNAEESAAKEKASKQATFAAWLLTQPEAHRAIHEKLANGLGVAYDDMLTKLQLTYSAIIDGFDDNLKLAINAFMSMGDMGYPFLRDTITREISLRNKAAKTEDTPSSLWESVCLDNDVIEALSKASDSINDVITALRVKLRAKGKDDELINKTAASLVFNVEKEDSGTWRLLVKVKGTRSASTLTSDGTTRASRSGDYKTLVDGLGTNGVLRVTFRQMPLYINDEGIIVDKDGETVVNLTYVTKDSRKGKGFVPKDKKGVERKHVSLKQAIDAMTGTSLNPWRDVTLEDGTKLQDAYKTLTGETQPDDVDGTTNDDDDEG